MAQSIKGDLAVTRGLGLGSMTTTQRLAYTPAAAGYQIYDTTLSQTFTWDGAAWQGPPASGGTIFAAVLDIAARDALTGMLTGDIVRSWLPAITWRYNGTAWQAWDNSDETHYAKFYKDADIPNDVIDPTVSGRKASITLTTAGQTRLIGYPAIGATITDEVSIDIRSGDGGFGGNLGPFTTTLVFDPVYKDPYGNALGTVSVTTTVAQEVTSYNFRRKANTSPVSSNEYWLVSGSKFAEYLKGGLAKKGTITSGADTGEGIYNLDASGAAFNFALPAATGSQSRYMFIGENVATNNVNIVVQAGENLNGVLNATKVLTLDGQVFLATDRSASNWDIKEIGAINTPVPLHYAQRSAWASFINVPLQTVPNVSDHGNNTVAAALSNRLNLSTAMTSSTSGITVGATDFTIAQDGRYRIAFEVEVEDATASASYGTVVQVVKNGIILTKAKARPSNSDSNSQYITTNPNGVISVDLIVGDVIDFRIASMNAAVSKDVTGYNIDIAQEASSTVIDPNLLPTVPLHRAFFQSSTGSAENGPALISGYTVVDDPNSLLVGNTVVVKNGGTYRVDMAVSMGDNGQAAQQDATIKLNGVIVASAGDSNNIGNWTTAASTFWEGILAVGDVVTFERFGSFNRGTSISVRQMAADTVILPSAAVVNSQPASGYIDIGTTRIQWGTFTTIGGSGSIVFPVPFSLVPVITGNVILPTMTPSSRSVVFSTVSNTGSIVASVTGAGIYSNNNVSWMAIGLK